MRCLDNNPAGIRARPCLALGRLQPALHCECMIGICSAPIQTVHLPSRLQPLTVPIVRWYAWIRLLALVVWLPATSHCRLAAIPALNFLACAHDSAGSHHETTDDGDGCAGVESGAYRSEESFDLPGPPDLRPDLLPVGVGQAWCRVSDPGCEAFTDTGPPPPDLPWQFVLRATGNPRAPSTAS